MTDQNQSPEDQDQKPIEIMHGGYATAAMKIMETLVEQQIEPASYPVIFKAVRLLLDPYYDDASPLERLSKGLALYAASNPQQTLAAIKEVFGALGIAPSAGAPVEVGVSPSAALDPVEAHVVVFVRFNGTLDAGIFSERTPTVTDGSRTFVACSGYGIDFDDAAENAIRNYRRMDLARVAPLNTD